MLMKLVKLQSTILGGIAFLSLASPSTAQVFSGNSSGIFEEPIPASATFTGVGTNQFTFGIPSSSVDRSNQLTFTGTDFSTETDTPFEVGTLTYFNGITLLAGVDVELIPFTVTLDFISPENFAESFTFTFDVEITPNNTGDPVLDADILTPPSFFPPQTFTFEGEELTLALLGFEQDGSIVENFVLPENAATTANLIAQINESPPKVPEPTAMLGLLLGVGAIAASKKASKNKVN